MRGLSTQAMELRHEHVQVDLRRAEKGRRAPFKLESESRHSV